MSTVLDRKTGTLELWKRGPAESAVTALSGQRPLELRLDRIHFPGKRPVQLVYTARMPTGPDTVFFAEHGHERVHEAVESAIASLKKSRNGQRTALSASSVIADPESGLVLRRPGLDERLPGLRVLHDVEFAREVVAGLTGQDHGPVRTRLMAHRLGKRAVIRIEAADWSAFARVQAIKSNVGESRLARHRAIWDALGTDAPLAIPKPLGHLQEIGVSLFAQLPGQAPDFSRDHDAIARSLFGLRGLEVEGLPLHTGTDEARLLRDWHDRCRTFRPDLADWLEPILARTCADLARPSGMVVPCHRDLHEKQILVQNARASILDFDTLSLADPGLDPGNLLAHLFFAQIDERPLTQALADEDVSLWRRAALLRIAMIYAFTATPDVAIRRLIDEAAR